MKKILLLGAGRSSVYLIDYLLENAATEDWTLIIADISIKGALDKLGGRPYGLAIELDVNNRENLKSAIVESSIVISLLPPALHSLAAEICMQNGRNLVTASYLSPEIKKLDAEAKSKGLILLNECGLDPGIDHLSAMQAIHKIKAEGGILHTFKSYCGGLVALECVDNSFGYKFSWNPRNVILAGQSTASCLWDGKKKFIPQNRIFSETESISFDKGETFCAYANRDSLSYIDTYSIKGVKTMLRGTLRYSKFCSLWNFFVQAGLTDSSFLLDLKGLTYKQLMEAFRPKNGLFLSKLSVEENKNLESIIAETGVFSDELIPIEKGSPADILQELLERKWKLKPTDKDRVVMQHIFGYEKNGQNKQLKTTMDITGKDSVHTAMAQTVGLPLAIATKLILQGRIKQTGAVIPVDEEFYVPILKELKSLGIEFVETEV